VRSMRPRRVRLGWRGHRHGADQADRRASMRPRRVGLGWDWWSCPLRHLCEASMRPRRVRLGWLRQIADVAAELLHASMRPRRVRLGWRLPRPRSRSRRAGFNEAEARAPRMVRCRRKLPHQVGAASMRPRRVRLGWSRVMMTSGMRLPGFNEAEARAPRMGHDGAARRGHLARFNEAEARAPRMAGRAGSFRASAPRLQ